MPGNRKIVFMGVSSLEHICTSNPNPRNKMTYDCLRGFGSLHDFARLGVENTFVPSSSKVGPTGKKQSSIFHEATT